MQCQTCQVKSQVEVNATSECDRVSAQCSGIALGGDHSDEPPFPPPSPSPPLDPSPFTHEPKISMHLICVELQQFLFFFAPFPLHENYSTPHKRWYQHPPRAPKAQHSNPAAPHRYCSCSKTSYIHHPFCPPSVASEKKNATASPTPSSKTRACFVCRLQKQKIRILRQQAARKNCRTRVRSISTTNAGYVCSGKQAMQKSSTPIQSA